MEDYDLKRKKNGRGRLRNISLKYKIASITVLVAFIPMAVLAVMMLFFYNRAILERGNRQIEENIRIMSDRISSVLKNGELCSNNLTIEFGNLYNDRNKKQVTRDSAVISQLSQSLLIYNGISSIVFMDTEGRFYSTDPVLADKKEEIINSSYADSLSGASGRTYLMNTDGNVMYREDKPVVTMGKHVINIVTGVPIGYLFINMDRDYLVESSQSEISYYFLYDTDGSCISDTEGTADIYEDEALIQKLYTGEYDRIVYEDEVYLTAKSRIPGYEWTIVGVTNLNRFNVTGKDLFFILGVTGGIAAVLLAVSVLASATFVTRPLKVLHDGAEQIAEGDMGVRFRFKTKDEIGRLGRIFNYMTQRNLELIQQVDDEAKKKREYELSLIQEQVKPHFLYNTLDIIIMLIEMKRETEAARVTRKLASYYKNSLSGSEEIVSIERELEIVRDYLELQMMRYGEKFTYGIDVDYEIRSEVIPKLTLQPLIENALYHGIKNKRGVGKITVTAKMYSDYFIIYIEDNGIGIEQERLAQIQEKINGSNGSGDNDEVFGLNNVNERIRLMFGSRYGVFIESKYGEGTKVGVCLPADNRDYEAEAI